MAALGARPGKGLTVRQSVAPRVVKNEVAMGSVTSTERFSVRVVGGNAEENATGGTSIKGERSEAVTRGEGEKILTTFIWKDLGSRVELAGSFDDWRKHKMEYVPSLGYHVLVVELPPGEYFYRFVVDGRWRIAEDDPNLREDDFGEWSHHLEIGPEIVNTAGPKRFSTSAITRVEDHIEDTEMRISEGESETESEGASESESYAESEDIPLPPRQRGKDFVADYDDDACGELDLQADLFEAMRDVKEVATDRNFNHAIGVAPHKGDEHTRAKGKSRGKRLVRQLFKSLFGKDPYGQDGNRAHELQDDGEALVRKNQEKHAMLSKDKGGKRGLKVWFPSERNFPSLHSETSRKVTPAEARDVVDVEQKAMRLNQVEENAKNRQMLGKTLFAQGKYDAALALFSLSVKLREDNGLRNAKTTAVAHTDVASTFIQLEDVENAEKHLLIAKGIFERACFSGGKANLGDVYFFLGVVKDMTNNFEEAAVNYNRALDLYERGRAQKNNPNWVTAVQNLKANMRRQRLPQSQGQQQHSQQAKKAVHRSKGLAVSDPRCVSRRMSSKLMQPPHATQQDCNQIEPQVLKNPYAPAANPQVNRNQTRHEVSPAPVSGSSFRQPLEGRTETQQRRRTWRDLAELARTSSTLIEAAMSAGGDTYEELARQWQQDGRKKMASGLYVESKDLLGLAIYIQRRHGAWNSFLNAECHEDLARVLFALSLGSRVSKKEAREMQSEAADKLRISLKILEELDGDKVEMKTGEVWGNLGLVLERMNDVKNAETAHTNGLVYYGLSGITRGSDKWKKAYKNWKRNLDKQGIDDIETRWGQIESTIQRKAAGSVAVSRG